MTDIFKHKFGGWHEADARRWKNPDGSEGGIVALSASVHDGVRLPVSVEVWPDAKIYEGTSIGDGTSIGIGTSIGDGASIGIGTSIGDGASIGYGTSIGDGASIGYGASIGDGASIGSGTSIEKDDWLFVAGPQGSRSAFATAVYSGEHGLRWWVGCQHGIATETLNERVERDHGTSEMGDDYRHLVQMVLSHPGLARAKANAGIE